MEDEKKYIVKDEDGVVLYDETDDLDPEDTVDEVNKHRSTPEIYPEYADRIQMRGIIKDKDGFRLKTNEEIFTNEHMREFDRKVELQKEKTKRTDRLVSIGVILFCILMIAGFILLSIWLN
ncbi:MAG: hypothetical protein K2N35_03465 [Muribaculaceae bacterium]|nr:hypothetical protein [Muribaculaceae bacterium]